MIDLHTVYVDVLIVVNLFIDFMLLVCTKRILHLGGKLIRLILSAILGGLFSLAALLPTLPWVLNLLMDFVFAAVMVLIAFGKTDVKSYCKRTAVFFAVSFSFCGVMVFVYTLFKPKGMEVYNDVVYFNISPILLIILTLVCYYTMKLINRFTKGETAKQVCLVRLVYEEFETEFTAMIDTGCDVREPFSGEYVIIVDKKLLGGLEIARLPTRVIPFNSLGGNGYIEGFRTERLYIGQTEISNQIYIGVCENILNGSVRAIVPYEITKNL